MTGQVQELRVEGFRSIRGLEIPFEAVNLITGPNGCGKSNLFSAFRLVKAAVEGRLSRAIADEGGMESILWAGPRPAKEPVRMTLAIKADPFEYAIELGPRPASEFPLFPLDPQIKAETLKLAGRVMVVRNAHVGHLMALSGPAEIRTGMVDSESVFAQVRDAARYPYLYHLRELVERWTFYHEFRSDPSSPARQASLPTYAPRLNEDGGNLGPSFKIIYAHGDADRLKAILAIAFPGSELLVNDDSIRMRVDGIHRPMEMNELSDGTLKFLCLAAACFATRPAPLLAFNEPEASLHPSAIEPLADAFAFAAESSQLWITTHSEALTTAMVNRVACRPIRLDKADGETLHAGMSLRRGWAES